MLVVGTIVSLRTICGQSRSTGSEGESAHTFDRLTRRWPVRRLCPRRTMESAQTLHSKSSSAATYKAVSACGVLSYEWQWREGSLNQHKLSQNSFKGSKRMFHAKQMFLASRREPGQT